MRNLINAELYKWMKSKSFKICTIIGIVMAVITVCTFLLLSVMMKELNEMGSMTYDENGNLIEVEGETDTTFTDDMTAELEASGMSSADMAMFTGKYDGELMLSMSFYQTSLQLLVAVFIAIFVAGEFSNGTIKMMVSRGYSRGQVYMAKLLAGEIAGNVMAVIIVAVTTVFGCILWGWKDESIGVAASPKEVIVFLLVQFLLNTAITAMFVAMAMLFKNLGASIAITISCYSFGSIVFVLADAAVKSIAAAVEYDVEKLPFLPSNLWIIQTIADMSTYDISNKDMILAIGVSVGYTLIFTLLGMLMFKKNDIK